MVSDSAVLSDKELTRLDKWWRACCYLAAGMIYLRDNPLLKEPLQLEHIKKHQCEIIMHLPGSLHLFRQMNVCVP